MYPKTNKQTKSNKQTNKQNRHPRYSDNMSLQNTVLNVPNTVFCCKAKYILSILRELRCPSYIDVVLSVDSFHLSDF